MKRDLEDFKIISKQEVYDELHKILSLSDLVPKKQPVCLPIFDYAKKYNIKFEKRYINKHIEDWDATENNLREIFDFVIGRENYDFGEVIFFPTPKKSRGIKMHVTNLNDFFVYSHKELFLSPPDFDVCFHFLFIHEKKILVFHHPGIAYKLG